MMSKQKQCTAREHQSRSVANIYSASSQNNTFSPLKGQDKISSQAGLVIKYGREGNSQSILLAAITALASASGESNYSVPLHALSPLTFEPTHSLMLGHPSPVNTHI